VVHDSITKKDQYLEPYRITSVQQERDRFLTVPFGVPVLRYLLQSVVSSTLSLVVLIKILIWLIYEIFSGNFFSRSPLTLQRDIFS